MTTILSKVYSLQTLNLWYCLIAITSATFSRLRNLFNKSNLLMKITPLERE